MQAYSRYQMSDRQIADRQIAGRQADRQTGRQADRQTGRQISGRLTDWQADSRQAGRQIAGRQSGKQADSRHFSCPPPVILQLTVQLSLTVEWFKIGPLFK